MKKYIIGLFIFCMFSVSAFALDVVVDVGEKDGEAVLNEELRKLDVERKNNDTDISTNVTSIASNAADIATNAADISTNADDIDTLEGAAAPQGLNGWIQFNGDGLAIASSYNVSSVTGSSGSYTVNWDTDFDNDDYCVVAMCGNTYGDTFASIDEMGAGYVILDVVYVDGTGTHATEATPICVMAIGD